MKRRFTLIEILAVFAIIGILAAIGFAGYSYAMSSARESATAAQIKQLSAGLENMRTKVGYYPSTLSGSTRAFQPIVITVKNGGLVDEISFGTQKLDSKAQAEFLRGMDAKVLIDAIGNNDQLEDAWGAVIYYAYPGIVNKMGYDLISAGPDGKFGADSAATPPTNAAKYLDGKEKISDDVTNF